MNSYRESDEYVLCCEPDDGGTEERGARTLDRGPMTGSRAPPVRLEGRSCGGRACFAADSLSLRENDRLGNPCGSGV